MKPLMLLLALLIVVFVGIGCGADYRTVIEIEYMDGTAERIVCVVNTLNDSKPVIHGRNGVTYVCNATPQNKDIFTHMLKSVRIVSYEEVR